MILLGDIGNTETKLCVANFSGKILKRFNLATKEINQKNIVKSFNKNQIKFDKITKILFCSVVPRSFKKIQFFLKKKVKIKIYEIKDLKLKKLLIIEANFKQVGSDRIANAISVINNKDNFIILDFGTATTSDVLVKNTYKGGIISPGVRLSLNTLSDKATLIPKINLKQIKKVIGVDTTSAVRSGFFWGYAGLIDNIINLIIKETRKSFKVIITGGFSELL